MEARRARDEGQPYTGMALGKKFQRSQAWGLQRLREIRSETGGSAGDVSAVDRVAGGSARLEVEPVGVAGWTESDLRTEIEWARSVDGPRDAALRIVQRTHDVVALAREDVEVSLDDAVVLVAAKVDEMGRDGAVRFSRELADRLGTQGTGLGPQADFPVSEEPAVADPVDDPMAWGFDPAFESGLDSLDVAGWPWGDAQGLGSDGA